MSTLRCPFCTSEFLLVIDGMELPRSRFEFLMRCAECEKRWKSNISLVTLLEWDRKYNEDMHTMIDNFERIRKHNESLQQYD